MDLPEALDAVLACALEIDPRSAGSTPASSPRARVAVARAGPELQETPDDAPRHETPGLRAATRARGELTPCGSSPSTCRRRGPLPEGRHELPWYLSDHDVRRLTGLLSRSSRRALRRGPGAETLKRLRPDQLRSRPECLVVVRIAAADVARESAPGSSRPRSTGSRAGTCSCGTRGRGDGYEWCAASLKEPILAALRRTSTTSATRSRPSTCEPCR